MGANRVTRLRERLLNYHIKNPNKPPIGAIVGGEFLRLEDAVEQLEWLAEATQEIEAEEREERLRDTLPVTCWYDPSEDI